MKKTLIRNSSLYITAITMLLFFGSCARKISFQPSTVVPAAQGKVKVKKDNNNNYGISISLDRLAEPEKLQPAKKVYVIWMETQTSTAKNLGRINSSSGFLSNKLKASFETVSSFKPSKIFITAEDEAGIQYPSGQVVLTTDIF